MGKLIKWAAPLIGLLLVGEGIYFRTPKRAMSVSVIGGADGPTSVFVAGKLNDSFGTSLIVGGVVILLIVLAVVAVQILRKKRQR